MCTKWGGGGGRRQNLLSRGCPVVENHCRIRIGGFYWHPSSNVSSSLGTLRYLQVQNTLDIGK